MKHLIVKITLFVLILASAGAQATLNAKYGYTVEPLVEWSINKAISTDEKMIFVAPTDDMLLTVTVTPAARGTLVERYRIISNAAADDAKIEFEEFQFNDGLAIFGSISWRKEGENILAYSLFTTNNSYDYHLLFIAERSVLEANLAVVFSTLDSFSLGTEGRYTEGPISQFDYPINGFKSSVKMQFNADTVNVETDLGQLDAAQRVVEREALVMGQYKIRNELAYLAWIRYYRAVYRDNYRRLTPIYNAIKDKLPSDEAAAAKMLLAYAQDYNYSRLETPSDLNAPVIALLEKRGDCDSMALSYLILLNHHGIDGALFLSQNLAHAVAGVKVETAGFKIEALGEKFVIAELTTKDSLGTIPKAVANNDDWFPLFFNAPRPS